MAADICDRPPRVPFVAFVIGTFLLGWALGAASVWKLWAMGGAPRGTVATGWGYVTFMVAPLFIGVVVTQLCTRLSATGWGWPSVRWALLGVTGAFVGFLVA